MLRRCVNQGGNLWFKSVRPFTTSLPSFSLFELNWSCESPFYSPSTWVPSLQRPFTFVNTACYAYYYQIISDLQSYYRMNEKQAHKAIYEKWIYLHLKIDNMELLDILEQEPPFYYATAIALAETDNNWVHKTEAPPNYQFCEEYKLLTTDEHDGYEERHCIKAFTRCADDLTYFTKYNDVNVVYYGSLDSFVNVMSKNKGKSAFYVTNYTKQAKLWAIRQAAAKPRSLSVVAQFRVNMDKCKSEYKWRSFNSYHDWADFVTKKEEHNFDAVEGPCYVNRGKSTPPRPMGHQIAIQSNALIQNELEYVGSISVY